MKVILQQLMMKNKNFDQFSFKAPSSQASQTEILMGEVQPKVDKLIKPSDIQYRHTEKKPKAIVFDCAINDRINNISNQLDQNIRRRLQLEKKLQSVKEEERKRVQKETFMAYSGNLYKEQQEVAKQFKKMNQKVDRIEEMVAPKTELRPQEIRTRQIEKTKQLLLRDVQIIPIANKQKILIPILQTLSSQKAKPLPVYTVPDQIKIQQLLRKVTFPQIPSGNLQSLRKQIQHLFALHQPHSDIHYLLMMIYFHEQQYMKVRKNFQQIIMFKVFNQKAYWIAAEAEFAMGNHELCLKLTEECLDRLDDKVLPRLVYLKGKSYEQLGDYISSIVCYNQLLRLKPKISEYYLERGLLYHRIGYYKQSKQDFVMFGILNPDGQTLIKNKILAEPNQIRKKEYIALLAKIY